ncbi:flagellar hook-basal body complex protein FliE [Szabonella alba]|uniref:Flagellar hook-basal body complex protein FliE n=1 Tax=Szabonella alba TaxID=2804194 RepID=A0A8K0VBU8_9RHOB|nr:flagellar hook-basal body complex protein FliE [Szabonella alba]MBL4917015.1 flagellar hook-basal body complex protein FliE [Szabonella alba]
MDIRPSFAAQSYLQAREAAAPGTGGGGGDDAGFARLAASFAQTLQDGESTARAAMTGGADPHALVEALAATQTAVETVVTVRDKVVEAYQEILRMPV